MRDSRRGWVIAVGLAAAAGAAFFLLYPTITKEDIRTATPPDTAATTTAATATEPINLLFIGDVMLDRNVALHAQEDGDGSLFGQIKGMFLGKDATIANLETTLTANPSISSSDHSILRFTSDPHFAAFLKSIGITAVSLSNNHTFDFGEDGYEQTKKFLTQAGVLSFGSPHNDDELSTEFTVRNIRVCLVGYEGFVNPDPAPIAAEITRIRPSCGIVIATMHAGIEYFSGYTAEQQKAAHAFIDAGADVVIGTHPHIVEPLEIYKGKPIFYSLGNFMFDQNFSFGTTHGLAVNIEWNSSTTRYDLIPITIYHEEVSLSNAADSATTLSDLIDNQLSSSTASQIMNTSSFTLPNSQ